MARTLQYWEAALPEPFTILGLRLRPFSLGHYFILKRFECSFVSDEPATATVDDLVFAVLVCSMTPGQFLDFVCQQRGGLKESFKHFIALRFVDAADALFRRSFWQEVAWWGRRCGKFDLSEKAKLFQAYIEEATSQPAYWVERDDGNAGGHWSHALLHILVSQCGYSQDDAINAPMSRCLQDYFKHAESCGCVRLMTPEEIKANEASC